MLFTHWRISFCEKNWTKTNRERYQRISLTFVPTKEPRSKTTTPFSTVCAIIFLFNLPRCSKAIFPSTIYLQKQFLQIFFTQDGHWILCLSELYGYMSCLGSSSPTSKNISLSVTELAPPFTVLLICILGKWELASDSFLIPFVFIFLVMGVKMLFSSLGELSAGGGWILRLPWLGVCPCSSFFRHTAILVLCSSTNAKDTTSNEMEACRVVGIKCLRKCRFPLASTSTIAMVSPF